MQNARKQMGFNRLRNRSLVLALEEIIKMRKTVISNRRQF
jgi:hypothetical protein